MLLFTYVNLRLLNDCPQEVVDFFSQCLEEANESADGDDEHELDDSVTNQLQADRYNAFWIPKFGIKKIDLGGAYTHTIQVKDWIRIFQTDIDLFSV